MTQKENQTSKFVKIFFCYFVIRLMFSFAIGFSNNYTLQPDSRFLINFANQAALGNFNFDYGRFITSPLYSVFAALHMLLFGRFWVLWLIISQISLSSLSGVYLYKITKLVFKDESVAYLAAVIYCVFPLTLWYVHTFCQETLFQCLFIFCIYHLIKAYQLNNIRSLVFSAILFSLAYLTKSHILIFSIFIPLLFIINLKSIKTAVFFSMVFASICLFFSLPYGLYNKFQNNTYVLSSNGAAYQFYLGNTNAGYITIVDVPQKGTSDYIKMEYINITAGYFNGSQRKYDSIISLPQSVKQIAFYRESLTWIKNHKAKWATMKIYDVGLFLMPGVSYRHYDLKLWLIAFFLSFPIYILAYYGFFLAIKTGYKTHLYFFSIFLSMLLFSTIIYVQNRFRTITLEPFLIIYAAYAIHYIYTFYKKSRTTKSQL